MASLQTGTLVYDYSVIDVIGPIDLLNMINKKILKSFRVYHSVDDYIIARAPDIAFHHIGVTEDKGPTMICAWTIMSTTTVDDCPELDILLLGGPDPAGFELDPKYAEFIRRHVAAVKLLLISMVAGV